MELKVGMYIRTKRGTIFKIIGGNVDKWYIDMCYYQLSKSEDEDYISYEYNKNDNLLCSLAKKTSENIIDLIEPGDILEINNEKYEVIYDESYEKLGILIPDRKQIAITHSALKYIFEKYKVSILTKEQFNSIKYEVGE